MSKIKREFLETYRKSLLSEIGVLETYLRSRVDVRDWHATADAANDIRVLEGQVRLIDQLLEMLTRA